MTAYKAKSWNIQYDRIRDVVTIDVLARGQCSIAGLTETENDLMNQNLALCPAGEQVSFGTIETGNVEEQQQMLAMFNRPGKWRLVAERIGK